MPKMIQPTPTPNLNQPFSAELLGQVIRARRTQSQLRLEDAAALCGVAKQTLMTLEHGKESTSLGVVLQVCQGLGIQLTFLPWSAESDENDWTV